MTLPTHIMVGTDFSNDADRALDEAVSLAQRFGARLTVAHVHASITFDSLLRLPPAELHVDRSLDPETPTRQASDVDARLARLAEFSTDGVSATPALIHGSNIASTLCAYAEAHDVDLIVLASHGRTGLERMLIGSVAERVVRHAPCPVLVTRASETARVAAP